MINAVPTAALSDFPETFKGPIYRPADDGYLEAKKLWNLLHGDRQPALIVRALDAEDVSIAVSYAAERDISVAVRSGGHGIDCYAMPHDGLVVDLSSMKGIWVDPDTGLTTAQAGVLLGEMDAATQAHGLVIPAGTVTETGVAGLTLGGGVGHLTRRFGATVDSVRSIDVVTMTGEMLTASAQENPDLFWGLRGAGHNLAIATSFTFQAHKLGPTVTSGIIAYSAEQAPTVFAGVDAAMARSPRELAFIPVILPAPPLPGMPQTMIGTPIVLAIVIYTGPSEGYESAMSEIRTLGAPLVDLVAPTSWVATNSMIDDFAPPGRRQYSGAGYLPAMTAAVAEIALEQMASCPDARGVPGGPPCSINFPILGGALHDQDEDSTAFSRTGAEWLFEVVGQWDQPSADGEYSRWVDDTTAALEEHSLSNGYVNLSADRGPAWLRSLYGSPAKWDRLVALKQAWDPENRLAHNKNIARAAADGRPHGAR